MTTAVPVPTELAPQVVTFKPEPLSFTIHNARRKWLEPMAMANLVSIPPVDVVGPHSDTDADGDPIPGTRVVSDIYEYLAELGDEILVFDSKKIVRHILGIQRTGDGKGAEAVGSYALSGVSLLPRHAPKSVWQPIAAAGEKRAFMAEVRNAKTTISDYDQANAKRKAAGMEPVSPGPDYDRARFLLEKYAELSRSEAEQFVAPHEDGALQTELELSAFTRAKAMELVEKATEGKNISKEELFNQLMGDADFRAKIAKVYSIRKRGHLPASEEQLKAAADAGLSVEEAGLDK